MLGIRASHLLPIQYLHDIYLFYPPSIPREAAGIICYTYILALYYLNTYSIIFHLNWHLLWDRGRLVPTMATSWQKEEARKSDGEGGRGGSWGVAPLLKSRDPTWQVGKNRNLSCFFSLLNCNTQIRTPTRGLRKPLLPSKTAYARVTFQEVPTRLPTRKMLQRSLYLTWCGHNSGSEEEYKELEDDDSLGDLWKEGGSLIKSGALCHDVIGNHDELMETLEKWNGKTLMGYGPQFDLGPPHFLREGLRGAYAKIRTENCCSKTWHL